MEGTRMTLSKVASRQDKKKRVEALKFNIEKEIYFNKPYFENERNAPYYSKSKGVWKDYQEDEPNHLKKCLDQDLQYGKIFKVAKDDYSKLQKAIFSDYLVLKNIFMYLTAKSSYPVIGWNDYSLFVHRSKLFDKKLRVVEVD